MPKLTVQQIIAEAELKKVGKPRSEGYTDDKASVSVEDIVTLVNDGADVLKTNQLQIGGQYYIHVVTYSGYTFQAVSEEPIDSLRK